MADILQIPVLLLVVLPSVLILAYPLFIRLAQKKFRRTLCNVESWPTLSVIVPLHGVDEGLRDNLRSWLSQKYEGTFEIIFSIEDESDSAVRVIREVIHDYPNTEARLLFSGSGTNHRGKIHNLVEALKTSYAETVMFLDSDVRLVSDDYLSYLVSPLVHSEVGLVTCAQVVYGPQSLGAGLITVMTNADLPGYFSTLFVTGNLNVANGAIMALRRDVVEQVGGLADLRNTVLNDTALARKVTAIGKQILLADRPALVYSGKSTLTDWWYQSCRWHVAMKSYLRFFEYVAYALSRIGLLTAALYVVFSPLTWFTACTLAVPLVSRTISFAATSLLVLRRRGPWRYFALIYLTDLMNPLFVLVPFITKKIVWRGRTYLVNRNAVIHPVEAD
jgi:ceramide glucosyltransferase